MSEPAPTPAPELPQSLSAHVGSSLAPASQLTPAPEPTPTPEPEPEPTPAPSPKPAPASKGKPAPAEATSPDEDDPLASLGEEEDFELPTDKIGDEEAPEPVDAETKAGRRIQTLKEEIKTHYKPEIERLKEEIAQHQSKLQAAEGANAELEELRKYKTESEAEMAVVRLQRTETYQKEVDTPLQQIASKATEIAEQYGIDTKKLFASFEASKESERRTLFNDAISGLDLNEEDKFDLRNLREQCQPLFARQAELESNAVEALRELEARKTEELNAQAAQRRETMGKTSGQVAARVVAKLPFLKSEVDGLVPKLQETDFDAIPDDRKAYNGLSGALLPTVVKRLQAAERERDSLLDELTAYRAAKPTVGGLGTAQTDAKDLPVSLSAAVDQGLAARRR